MKPDHAAIPLVARLSDVLIAAYPRDEVILDAVRHQPRDAIKLFLRGIRDRSALDLFLTKHAQVDAQTWPLNEPLVSYLKDQARNGRRIVLASNEHQAILDAVVKRFDFPCDTLIVPTDDTCTGGITSETLETNYPEGVVFATSAFPAASPDDQIENRVSTERTRVFGDKATPIGMNTQALRLHQWAKNLLIFIPLVLAGKIDDATAWGAAFIGFLAFGLVASATYLVNDLIDLTHDRLHWSKRSRALASGRLSIRSGAALAAGGLLAGMALALPMGNPVAMVLASYLILTLAYSFHLKKFPIVDVFVLATLFTLRLAAGIVVTDVKVSPWLLVFSMFVFFSLSLAKRHTEIVRMEKHGKTSAPGRGYRSDDAPLTLGLGLASMTAAILIMVLYLIEDAFPTQIYEAPVLLWSVPPILLLFLGRIWLTSQRGELQDDPVAFAIQDPVCLGLGITMVVCVSLAIVGFTPL